MTLMFTGNKEHLHVASVTCSSSSHNIFRLIGVRSEGKYANWMGGSPRGKLDEQWSIGRIDDNKQAFRGHVLKKCS